MIALPAVNTADVVGTLLQTALYQSHLTSWQHKNKPLLNRRGFFSGLYLILFFHYQYTCLFVRGMVILTPPNSL